MNGRIHITTDLEDEIRAKLAEIREAPPADVPPQWLKGWTAALTWVLSRANAERDFELTREVDSPGAVSWGDKREKA